MSARSIVDQTRYINLPVDLHILPWETWRMHFVPFHEAINHSQEHVQYQKNWAPKIAL